MKKSNLFILMLLALLCMNTLQAQVNIGGTPKSYEYEKNGMFLEPPVFVQTAPLNMAAIEAEDAQWELERSLGGIKIGRRFGIEFEVAYDLYNSGTWTYFPDGSELWRLGVECTGALTINLIFDRYRLPAGATLYIYNVNKRDMIGGFTNYNNQADYYFATDVVDGDKIIIEYYQPANTEFEAELRLGTIVHGYRGTLIFEKGFGQSGSCQRNSICPEGAGYEDQIRATCALYRGGTELCSGALISNTANDKKPYVLTANHCLGSSSQSTISTWVFRFRWESATCTPSTNNTNYRTMSGATFRMNTPTSTSATDCLLVELNQAIPNDYDVYFAGWSRATTAPPSVLIIHHPNLDIKKITPSTNVTAVTQYVLGWRANFPVGGACTEPGSSGSPIFDHNHRIIGQEYGGQSACGASASQMFDVWGRFDLSWNYGSTAATRLRDWLDPDNLNPDFLDGLDNMTPVLDAELFEITVPAATYVEETIEPTVTIKNKGNITITSATVSYTVDGGTAVTKTWTGTLTAGTTTTVKFDAVTFAVGTHTFTATITVPDDANPANDSKTINFEVLATIIDAELLNILIPKPIHHVAETIEPTITIKNNGNKAMTAATVSYTIDEGTAVTKEWTGTLAVGTTTTVKFEPVAPLTVETHTFSATVTIPNDANPANDSKTINFEIKDCLPVQNITIEDIENTITLKWEAPVNKDDITGYEVSID
ncbi:MAG: trypsin-like peptidase domain-containing protein, partial [Bacteroidetes bacterium]|nr:trypsin-like peptidase domain-containing protein [Bacteroidota bacterium]